jgi:hypothetical protein
MELLLELTNLASRVWLFGAKVSALRKVIRVVNLACYENQIELPYGQELINSWLRLINEIEMGSIAIEDEHTFENELEGNVTEFFDHGRESVPIAK